MTIFRLSLWSQQEGEIIHRAMIEGTRLDAERALSNFWNNSLAVVSETGRYRARLHEVGNRRALSIIG